MIYNYLEEEKRTMGNGVYAIEEEKTRDEKIEEMDAQSNGLITYLLALTDKFNDAKETEIKHDKTWKTCFHQGSLKAWFRRNDTREIIDTDWRSGYTFYVFEVKNSELTTITPIHSMYSKNIHGGEDIVNQWYHNFVNYMIKQERRHFIENDEKQQRITKMLELDTIFNLLPRVDRFNISDEIITKYTIILTDLNNALIKAQNDIEEVLK